MADEPPAGGTALPTEGRRDLGRAPVAKRPRVAPPRPGLGEEAGGRGGDPEAAVRGDRGGRSGEWPPTGGGHPTVGGGRTGGHLAASDAQVEAPADAVDRGAAAGGDAAVGPAVHSDRRGCGPPPGRHPPPGSLQDEAPPRPRVRRRPVVPLPPDDGLGSNTSVPGMLVFAGALTTTAAAALLTAAATDDAAVPWVNVKTRWMKQYGPRFNFRTRLFGGPNGGGSGARRPTPLPPYVATILLPLLRERVPGLASWAPNQLCLNRYEAGTGHAITPHNDNEGGGLRLAVAGICIGASATMTFLHANGAKRDVALPAGCVYVMSGDAFEVWRHAIFASNIDYRRGGGARVSLTLRQVEERQALGGGGGAQPRAASLTGGAKRAAWPRVCGPMDAFTRPSSPGGAS